MSQQEQMVRERLSETTTKFLNQPLPFAPSCQARQRRILHSRRDLDRASVAANGIHNQHDSRKDSGNGAEHHWRDITRRLGPDRRANRKA